MDHSRRLDSTEAVALVERADAFLVRATLIIVLLLVPLAYLPLRNASYVDDDRLLVEQNPVVARGNPAEILASPYGGAGQPAARHGRYRPVTVASFALERRLSGGPSSLVSHVVNVLLHLGATLALFALVRRLGAQTLVAAAATLIFAVHPIHVDAVARVVGRAEMLAALFSFAALIALSYSGAWPRDAVAAPRHSGAMRRLAAWTAALLLLLALGSKEVAVATLGLLLALEWLFRPVDGARDRAWWIDRAAAVAPSLLAAGVYFALRLRALETLKPPPVDPLDNPLVLLAGGERIATALALLPRYVGLMFYPLGLSADYSGPVIPAYRGLLQPLPLAGLLILSALIVLGIRPLLDPERTRRPNAALVSFGGLLFLLPYLIVGNLLFRVGPVFAERLLYLPSAGFCLVLGLIIGAVSAGWVVPHPKRDDADRGSTPTWPTWRLAAFVLAALVAGFSTLTWARCLDWRDDETLFGAAIRTRPHSPRAHLLVGRARLARGEDAAALGHFDRAIRHYPRLATAWVERGRALDRLGRAADAEASLREALRLRPDSATAHLYLGRTLRRQGRSEEAERSRRKALLWDPSQCDVEAGQTAVAPPAIGRGSQPLPVFSRDPPIATSSASDIACATRRGWFEPRIAPHTATPRAPA